MNNSSDVNDGKTFSGKLFKVDKITKLSEDISLHSDIFHEEQEIEYYFDASDVIKMIAGFAAIDTGKQIIWNHYNSCDLLVYCFAYYNWSKIGNIHLLPPHMDEFLEKMDDNFLFPGSVDIDRENRIKDFYGTIRIDSLLSLSSVKSADQLRRLAAEIKSDSPNLFKSNYLISHGGSWKRRYRYLVKESKILKFPKKQDYEISSINNSELFDQLKKELDKHRKLRGRNNYNDALALCILQEKLIKYKEGKGPLPIFYSNQRHIKNVVKKLNKSDNKLFNFSKEDDNKNEKKFIVQDAEHFITKCALPPDMGKEEKIKEFKLFMESVEKQKKNFKSTVHANVKFKRKESKGFVNNKIFQEASEKVTVLEFFDQWWHNQGHKDFFKNAKERGFKNKVNEHDLTEEIDSFIELERRKLRVEFKESYQRIEVIGECWEALGNIRKMVKGFDNTSGENLYKEFGTRFAYTEKCCNYTQKLLDDIFSNYNRTKDSFVRLESAISKVITHLVNGVLQLPADLKSNEAIEIRVKFASSMAVLWKFKKYKLIDFLAKKLREKCSVNEVLAYPDYQIALLHFAAIHQILPVQDPDNLDILKCVEKKAKEKNDDSYPIRTSLSYAYYIKWSSYQEDITIPERRTQEEWQRIRNDSSFQYLEKAIENARKAFLWLKVNRKEAKGNTKKTKRRQRMYYYALNNLVFFITIAGNISDLIKIEKAARGLSNAMNIEDYHQVRYFDTYGWLFLRKAAWAETHEQRLDYLDIAKSYNKDAFNKVEKEDNDSGIFKALKEEIIGVKYLNFRELEEIRKARASV